MNKFANQSDIINILYCLNQFGELKKEFIEQNSNNQNALVKSLINFFKNNQNVIEIQANIFNNCKNADYKNTILILLEELNKNLNTISNNNYIFFNLNNQKEETQKLSEFIVKKLKGSIIDYSFYYVEEINCYCSLQNKYDYKFETLPFISVKLKDLPQNYKFSEMLKPKKKYEKCKFCGKNNNKCFIENKIVILPRILIIILDGIHEQNFQIKHIINHEKVRYKLKCFIDNKKFIYFTKDGCHFKYDENYNIKTIDNFEGLYPVILFYSFTGIKKDIKKNAGKNTNNINNINSINNINNINNINPNMNQCNMNNNNINFMNNNMNNMNNNMNNINNNNMNSMNNNMKIMNNNINNMNNNKNNINNNMNIMNNNMNFNPFNNINQNMNNNNIQNNNINSNQNNMKNNVSFNNKSNINNQNCQNTETNNGYIFVTFTFKKYNKQIFLDIYENMLFKDVIIQLEEKYSWLKSIKNKYYYFKDKKIDINKTVKKLNIKDNSDIIIQI